MVDIINNLVLWMLAGCVILIAATVTYIIGVVKYSRKYMILVEELEKIKTNNMINNMDI